MDQSEREALLYYASQLQRKYTDTLIRERLTSLMHTVEMRLFRQTARAFRRWTVLAAMTSALARGASVVTAVDAVVVRLCPLPLPTLHVPHHALHHLEFLR